MVSASVPPESTRRDPELHRLPSREAAGHRGHLGFRWCGLSLPSRAHRPATVRPGQIITGASSLVVWAGAASSATSLVALAFLIFRLASACSAATCCLAAILAAVFLVVTAAASAADSMVVFIKSFGTKNVPNLLCWAKTWWSCDPGVDGLVTALLRGEVRRCVCVGGGAALQERRYGGTAVTQGRRDGE